MHTTGYRDTGTRATPALVHPRSRMPTSTRTLALAHAHLRLHFHTGTPARALELSISATAQRSSPFTCTPERAHLRASAPDAHLHMRTRIGTPRISQARRAITCSYSCAPTHTPARWRAFSRPSHADLHTRTGTAPRREHLSTRAAFRYMCTCADVRALTLTLAERTRTSLTPQSHTLFATVASSGTPK